MPFEQGYVDIIQKVAPDQGSGKIDVAKKVLTDAGYTFAADGKLKDKTGAAVPPLGFTYTKGKAQRAATGEVVQAQLKKIGIDVVIKTTDDLSGTLAAEDFDMIIFGWAFSPLKSTNQDLWKTGGGNNFTQWGDPKSDELLVQMATELDSKKVIDLLNQQDEILTKAAVVLSLFQKPNMQVTTKDYVNVRDNNSGSYFTYNTQEWGVKAA
jgi:peptide/nickel transport system substrate-binding protein